MARRGKSSSRRSRQRRRQQAPRASAPTPRVDVESPASEETAPEARTAPLFGQRSTPPRSRAADPRVIAAGPSRLSERAAAEYHYVLRDLRNIGFLVVVMAFSLAAATILVNVLGVGRPT